MDTELDAREYQAMDHAVVNAEFVARLLELAPKAGTLLDAGTGPGEIPVRIAERAPGLFVTAIDLAEHMLALAREGVERAGLGDRIRLVRADAKATGFPPASFDMVVSNSLVHHLPEPIAFLREALRLARPGAGLCIRDLLRPSTKSELDALVGRHTAHCSDYQRGLFSASLNAGLTLEEVTLLCREASLKDVVIEQCSDRHWSIERRHADVSHG